MIYIFKPEYARRKGWLRQFLHRVFGRKVTVSGVKVSGVECCLISVDAADGISWDEVDAAVGGPCKAVFPKGIVPPKDSRIIKINGEALRRRVLINGALFALETAAAEGKAVQSVALLDRDGEYASLIEPLMKSVQTVAVVTRAEEVYTPIADRMFEQVGAAPLVTDSASTLSGCKVIIAPEGLGGFGAVEVVDVMFTPESADGFSVNAGCINAPFAPKLIAEYDAFELLTAFCEAHKFASADSLVPQSFVYGEKQVALGDVVRRFCT